MAFTEGSNSVALNGVTEVTLVPAPAAATRRLVRWGSIANKDTAAVVLTVSLKITATLYRICRVTLQPDDTLLFDDGDLPVLDATSKSLVAVLAGAPAMTNPDANLSYGDAS